MDGQKTHIGIKKLGGMMMLAIVVSGKRKLWKEWKRKNKQEVFGNKEKG